MAYKQSHMCELAVTSKIPDSTQTNALRPQGNFFRLAMQVKFFVLIKILINI